MIDLTTTTHQDFSLIKIKTLNSYWILFLPHAMIHVRIRYRCTYIHIQLLKRDLCISMHEARLRRATIEEKREERRREKTGEENKSEDIYIYIYVIIYLSSVFYNLFVARTHNVPTNCLSGAATANWSRHCVPNPAAPDKPKEGSHSVSRPKSITCSASDYWAMHNRG